jgi:S1-C subfamily serine protease
MQTNSDLGERVHDKPSDAYIRLEPLSIDDRLRLALFAMEFFSPFKYEEHAQALGKAPVEGTTLPFTGEEFLIYLKKTNKMSEAGRYRSQIRELISSLVASHFLVRLSHGDTFFGGSFYTMKIASAREKRGVLCLTQALGAEFVAKMYSLVTVQITGTSRQGDAHAGTGVVISPNWVLTCAHVLDDMTLDDQQTFQSQKVTVRRTHAHPTIDVGLIEVSESLQVLPDLAFRPPVVGENVFTYGFPRIPLSKVASTVLQRGEVTNEEIENFDSKRLFLYSAIARPGNSGGPVIANSGHLVGIVSQEMHDKFGGTSSSFFAGVSCSTIDQAMREMQVPVSLPIETYK